MWSGGVWLGGHWYVLVTVVGALWGAGEMVASRLAVRASAQRTALEVVAGRLFEPSLEEIFRHGVQLARASTSMPWWAPRRSKAVRIRLRADGTSPLRYRIEGPAGAQRLLAITPFGPHVTARPAVPIKDAARRHTVRAEFVLRGRPTGPLREVPLAPDPLQPLVDAVADLRAGLGDLAEIRLDIQRAPKWALRTRRLELLAAARRQERKEAERAARWLRRDAARVEDSLLWQVRQLLAGKGDTGAGRRLVMPPVPRRIDPQEALGKLSGDEHLVRVQLLVLCASDVEGRAFARLAQVQAALDVFGGSSRWAMRGWRLGPWRAGADRWPGRRGFDRRWQYGWLRPPRANWVRLDELTGLLKPPTVHCRLPLLPTDLPTFDLGNPELLLQGHYQGPDGRRRLVATYADETLFEVGVGRAGGGKTERALAQAIGWAHAGGGLLFMDPHRDSWPRALPFLAHDHIAARIALIDLGAIGPTPSVSAWNPLAMQDGQAAHEVVEAVADAFATVLGWDDATAPRAQTILTACLTVLTAVNQAACTADRRDAQATVFQIRALLTDTAFRATALTVAADRLDDDVRAWWQAVFPRLPDDAFTVVLNPLARLAAHPVTHAFLGQPVGHYDSRAAMDHGMIVWVCPGGHGPTDRLLTALLTRDLLRAARARRAVPLAQRRLFRLYFDELITLTGAAPETIAAMFEDLRKYRVTVHGLTQLLSRLPAPVQASLTQNASTLASTSGSVSAIAALTAEWGGRPSPAEVAALERYQHYMTLTVHGGRVGPVRITGPHLDDVFADLARPRRAAALESAAQQRAGCRPLHELSAHAALHGRDVLAFLTEHASTQENVPPPKKERYT
ncbi:ATP/GTP-binding protein [Streptomyces mangrovisoli]|nr:ATP/GTP-binding protein [Streptomyces mangrovisoli]